jgi:hypothetical protein
MRRIKMLRTVAAAFAIAAAATVLTGVASPASAAPASALSPQAVPDLAAFLPAAGPAGIKEQPATLTLTEPHRPGVVTPDATIICTARSSAFIRTQGGLNSVFGRGSSTCPVAMTSLIAQTHLFEWNAFVGQYLEIRAGNYASGPGTEQVSETGEYTCNHEPRTYVAVTFHYARLGQAAATAVSQSATTSCQIVGPF